MSENDKQNQERRLGTGLRFNNDKLRYDLLNPFATEGLVEVLTSGARVYQDHNWEYGMSWSTVIASMKRHLAAIEKGEDRDISGNLHIDHVQANAHFLSAYYRIFPQGDDRFVKIKPKPKIGLDLDEVLCNWVKGWTKLWKMEVPENWHFDKEISERFAKMKEDGLLDDFYKNLEPLTLAKDLPFEPHVYVTSRPVDSEVTVHWLEKHGFPLKPVITVGINQSKVDVIKEAGVDIFIDDRWENFEELNRHGVCCLLFDAPHNRRYDVGYKRIRDFKDLKDRFVI